MSCHNWLTQLALWPNSNGVPRTLHIIHSNLLPPWSHTLVTGTKGDGNSEGGPVLVTGTNKGTHGDGNGRGGPVLAMDVHCNDNKSGNVQGDPAPTLGK